MARTGKEMNNSINRDSNYLLTLEIKGQCSYVIRFQRFCVDKLDNIDYLV